MQRSSAFALSMVITGMSTIALLNSYTQYTLRAKDDPPRSAAVLDAQGRLDAIEHRKRMLPISGLPYVATSDDLLAPLHDDARQRRVDSSFIDKDSGLEISAETHLCLPGIDPCISGGQVTVSNGRGTWNITFQFLGSTNPSRFHSMLPRSRKFLQQLQILASGTESPERTDYYQALNEALTAKSDSPNQQVHLMNLVRLLLASYFLSEEFSSTLTFAEEHNLLESQLMELQRNGPLESPLQP